MTAGPTAAPHPASALTTLSPSGANDFQSCPLLFRFRRIDRLPEPPGVEAQRGTLVHDVLEQLFDLPGPRRTLESASLLLEPTWATMLEQDADLSALLFGPAGNWERRQRGEPLEPADEAAAADFLVGARDRLERYFGLEDPTVLDPAEREFELLVDLPNGVRLRGFLDRLDRAPDGRTRVVDYKTGRAPRDDYAQQAMFQLRCYAVALWRRDDAAPTVLQLLYLGDGQVLRYQPDEADLRATERKLGALWQAIMRAESSGDWRPRPGRLCDWCNHRALCPAWGGTPPPLPVVEPGPGA
jgi:putative RecB family exonuclease